MTTTTTRASLLALTLLSPAALVACSGTADDPSGDPAAACEQNPEAPAPPAGGLAPRAITPNGASLNGGGENGVRVNGIRHNGAKFNGARFNGVKLNGLSLNGVRQNGITLNGLRLNGVDPNGRNLNGLSANGMDLNGMDLNGVYANGVTVAGNELVGTSDAGKLLTGDAFVGATLAGVLTDGTTIELRIGAFEREGAIAYYRLEHDGQSLCADGERGMFLPGSWDATGKRHDAQAFGASEVRVSYSCTSGALAKCVVFGYAPWTVGADLHQACTRMVRADYCGSGTSYTKDGTLIDMFDPRGVQSPANEAGFAFEAAWGPDGAVCANRPRFDARTVEGDRVLPGCWSSLPPCTSLEEGVAKGGLLANASRPQSRTFCR